MIEECNPTWKIGKEFFYETKYADKLHQKTARFLVMGNQMIGDDIELGYADVDLLSIASGPVLHELTMKVRSTDQIPGQPPIIKNTRSKSGSVV